MHTLCKIALAHERSFVAVRFPAMIGSEKKVPFHAIPEFSIDKP